MLFKWRTPNMCINFEIVELMFTISFDANTAGQFGKHFGAEIKKYFFSS